MLTHAIDMSVEFVSVLKYVFLAIVTNNVILVNVVRYSTKKYVVTCQFVTSQQNLVRSLFPKDHVFLFLKDHVSFKIGVPI